MTTRVDDRRVATGIPGLDEVLQGGLPLNRVYLVQGDPGAGKTTLGLRFLLEGARLGQSSLYVSFSETEEEVQSVARSHGWSLDRLHLFEMSAAAQPLSLDEENTLFEPSEIELREVMQRLMAEIERVHPDRVVIDSLSELRLLSQSALRYRRHLLMLKQFLVERQSTVLLLDDQTSDGEDKKLQSLAHGVITLENLPADLGRERRRLRVVKLRGVKPRGGYHEFVVVRGGLDVFPRLVASEHQKTTLDRQTISSGVSALDELLGGGVDRGTATLFIGPAGSGKSSLALRYALSAAERGEHAAFFAFDERISTLMARAEGLGLNVEPALRSGKLRIKQVDPADMGPGEFVAMVQRAVLEDGAKIIVIDSLNGYLNAMPEERALALQLHELLSALTQQGVTSFMVMAQHGLFGPAMASPVDVSYIADTVVLLRYFEAEGTVRKAISVVKKRSGPHENTIRECRIGPPSGIQISPPLVRFRGVLTGVPTYEGTSSALIGGSDEERPS